MKWLIIFSTWVENNSGQIQILIALVAIGLAIMAYKKVLEQIDISNKQTEVSIAQMNLLNKERVFELRLRLIARISEQMITLGDLDNVYATTQNKLNSLFLKSLNFDSEVIDKIDLFEREKRTILIKGRFFVVEYKKKIDDLLNKVDNTREIDLMESVLEEIEQYQIIYNSKFSELKFINQIIEYMFMGLDTPDPMKTFRVLLGVEAHNKPQ